MALHPASPNPSDFSAGRPPRTPWLRQAAPLILLVAVALAAYANAWPNALVHDDKFFAGGQHLGELSNIPRYFRENAWASSGVVTNFYRPLLLSSITLDARAWGDWVAGYHLSNILLHALATVLVYGFVLQVLRMTADRASAGALEPQAREGKRDSFYALLAALVFAVHPENTEVVNSIFNRSDILATVGGLGALLWFLRNVSASPGKAWWGLGLLYFVTLFCKESAAVIPGLAVVLIMTLSPGDPRGKLMRCLPALLLLLPLALYLGIRALALAPVESATAVGAAIAAPAPDMSSARNGFSLPDFHRLMGIAGVAFESLKIFLWPFPLRIKYPELSDAAIQVGVVVNAALIVVAAYLYRRKRPELLTGLAFFYLALLPASRLAGDSVIGPHVAERYLYFPSVGLILLLAFGLRFLGRRMGTLLPAVAALLAVAIFTPATWARNDLWSNEIELFEYEYQNGNRETDLLVWLTAAHVGNADYQRVAELCDDNHRVRDRWGKLSLNCGAAYGRLGRTEDAEAAYRIAAGSSEAGASGHANLARLYLRQGRLQDAREHFELAAAAETSTVKREYRLGYMLAKLYPRDRDRLLEARAHFETALELQPGFAPARQWLQQIDQVLATAD